MQHVRPNKRIMVFCLSFISWGVMLSIWSFIWMHYYAGDILRPFGYKGNWLVVAVYGILLLFFTQIYGGYRIGYYQSGDVAFSGILAMVITNGITYLQVSLIARELSSMYPFLGLSIAQAIIISLWSFAGGRIYMKMFPPWIMLMVYGGSEVSALLMEKMAVRSEKYTIREAVSIDEGLPTVYNKIMKFEAVIICDVGSPQRNQILKYCYSHNIRVYLTPKISDIIIRGSKEVSLFDSPLMLIREYGISTEQLILKRIMDIIISVVALLISSPILIATIVAIKLQDNGPVFFFQKRCTKDNRIFEVIKFRSMIVDAEKDGKPHPAVDNDPRITKVGNIIRKTRIDELPQFINILKGEMSVVGPRPERIENVQKYTEEIAEFSYRSKVKAGLTGYAQIVGRYNTSAYDKLKMDLMYITNYSVFEDIKLILMTIKIIFKKGSTKGFN